MFTPVEPPRRRTRTTASGSTGLVDADGVAVRRSCPPIEVQTVEGAGGRPLPARATATTRRRAHGRDLRPLHRARWTATATAAAFQVTAGGNAVDGQASPGPSRARCSCSARRSRSPTARRSSPPSTRTAVSRAGTASRRHRPRTFTVEPKPAQARAAPRRRAQAAHAPSRSRSRAAAARSPGSWSARRGLLPAADELHADRAAGSPRAASCSSPGGRDVAPLALSSAISSKVVAAVRQAPRHPRHLQPLHRRQPGRPAPPRRLHQLPLGARTSAAAPATRTAPSSGSHLFFQSEKPYNGGHYVNLMNAALRPGRHRRLGVRRPRPPGGRLLPPLTVDPAEPDGDHRAGDARHRIGEHRPVIRNVVIHVVQRAAAARRPVRPADRGRRRPAVHQRALAGRQAARSSSTTSTSTFFFPYHIIRFLEIPEGAVSGRRPSAGPPAGATRPARPATRTSAVTESPAARGGRCAGRAARRRRPRRRARDRRGLPAAHPRHLRRAAAQAD